MFSSAVRTTLTACHGYECQEKDGIFMLAFHEPGGRAAGGRGGSAGAPGQRERRVSGRAGAGACGGRAALGRREGRLHARLAPAHAPPPPPRPRPPLAPPGAALEWACVLHLALMCVHWAPEVLASPAGREVHGPGGELLFRGIRARVAPRNVQAGSRRRQRITAAITAGGGGPVAWQAPQGGCQ